MRIASAAARFLLGLIFLVFGLNGFFHFLPFACPHRCGFPAILLLINRYVPFGLTLLGPVIVNIFCLHAFLEPRVDSRSLSGYGGSVGCCSISITAPHLPDCFNNASQSKATSGAGNSQLPPVE